MDMQKIALAIALILFVYLAYRYMNMKPIDKRPVDVAKPDEDDSVPTVPIKEDAMDKEE